VAITWPSRLTASLLTTSLRLFDVPSVFCSLPLFTLLVTAVFAKRAAAYGPPRRTR
jgi:hypothetical protein